MCTNTPHTSWNLHSKLSDEIGTFGSLFLVNITFPQASITAHYALGHQIYPFWGSKINRRVSFHWLRSTCSTLCESICRSKHSKHFSAYISIIWLAYMHISNTKNIRRHFSRPLQSFNIIFRNVLSDVWHRCIFSVNSFVTTSRFYHENVCCPMWNTETCLCIDSSFNTISTSNYHRSMNASMVFAIFYSI